MRNFAHLIRKAHAVGSRFVLLAMAALLLTSTLTLTACKSDGSSITVDTNKARQIVAAAAFAAKEIESLPVISQHLSAADEADFKKALLNIQSMATMAASQSSSVTLSLGTNWMQDLISDIQILTKIALPIVQQFAPSAVIYVQTVSNLIPLLDTFLPVSAQTPQMYAASKSMTGSYDYTMATIYAGPRQ